jgi:hypothetical protein
MGTVLHYGIPYSGKKLGWFTFLLLLTAVQPAFAQKVQFGGAVRDSLTGEALPLVGVALQGTNFGVNTNLEGDFLMVVPPGEYLLRVHASGYYPYMDSLHLSHDSLDAVVDLRPVSLDIEGLTISSKAVNPAHRVIRNAIAHRRQNRFDKIDAYEYEAYNKLVITMDNVSDHFLENKLVRNVGRSVRELMGDSTLTDTSRFKLAVFVSESVSKFYYQQPDKKKEEILAVRTSGVEGSEYNLLSSMFLQLDMYDNNVVIVDRTFLSPIADGAFVDYDFELVNVETYGRDTLYGIDVIPKRPFDPVFKGRVYIDNHDWALNRLDLQLNDNPNINFVEDIRIRQAYEKKDSFWVPTLLDIEVDFQNSFFKRKGGDGVGAIGRSSSHLYNYRINQPREPRFYQQEILEVQEDANERDSLYWAEHRKTPLEKSEELGFALVDSLKSRGLLDFWIEAGRLIAWGTYKFPKIEIGPYFYLLGFNQAEGWRTRFGVYTRPMFSKRLYLGGHLAYGFRDRRFKYLMEGKFRLIRKPKLEIGFRKIYEVEQAGFKDFLNNGTSLLQSSLRRVPLTQLNYYHEHKLTIESDITKGLAGKFHYRTKTFEPASTFPFAFAGADGGLRRGYNISEAGAEFRVSFKEEYIMSRRGDKTYLGTKFPIFVLSYAKGFAGFLDGQFNYHRAEIEMRNFLREGRYGWLRYDVTAGQVFGTLPYPSLQVFQGNQTWGYDKTGFNLMNYYEFVADRYLTVALEQHFEGLFWNMLPGLRKLKWKEVVTARLAMGSISEANRVLNTVNVPLADGGVFSQTIQAPSREPYLETGVGLYNIFKVLRVDGIWRLNYHDLSWRTDPSIPKANWGKFNNFGLRVDLSITF